MCLNCTTIMNGNIIFFPTKLFAKTLLLNPREKFIFCYYLSVISPSYNIIPNLQIEKCSRVWEYRKLDFKDEESGSIPWIVRIKRYLLQSTNCDKCVVTGCYQDK